MERKPVKISIGMKLRTGPWGGSNQFAVALTKYLQQRGVEVSFDLREPDLDIIVLTDPRRQGMSATYRDREIISYLLRKNWSTLVVHRVNECDERKGTTDVNAQLIAANACADHTVFISHWLRNLFLEHGLNVRSRSSVIWNGAEQQIFHANGYQRWNHVDKLRIVTHHWGGGWLKGFDVYERLDHLLATSPFNERIAFTYIGNVPEGFRFSNASHLAPQSGMELADSLRRQHVYLTASQHEPAGMHHIEGGLCGLPFLYRESGALPEYCQGFGIAFTSENFEEKLWEMLETYDAWQACMKKYANTAECMAENYYNLFCKLLEQRDTLLRQRMLRQKKFIWLMKAAWRRLRQTTRRLKNLSRVHT